MFSCSILVKTRPCGTEDTLHVIELFDGLVQEICNCIANALELRRFCTNPSISNWYVYFSYNMGLSIHKNVCTLSCNASTADNPCDL